jgi:hypothetical protein
MELNKERAFEVLKKISFERIAGTEKELECANILLEECHKAGVEARIEEFEIDMPEILEVSLEVTAPTPMTIPCIGIGKSGQTVDEGIVAPFVYAEDGLAANLMDCKGKIVLLTGALKPEVKLGKYKGVKVDKVDVTVTDEEVDAEINKERENNARNIEVTDRAVKTVI